MVDKIGGAGSQDEPSVQANVMRSAGNDQLGALVVSGPGGPAGRVTNLALAAVEVFAVGGDFTPQFDEIQERLHAHAEPFGQHAVRIAETTAHEMHSGMIDGRGLGWVVMGPERYMAEVYANQLQEAGRETTVVNPTAWMQRDRRGALDLQISARGLSHQLSRHALNVIPGSPGSDSSLRTVPVTPGLRGYTDITGMVVAESLQQQSEGRQVVYRIIKDDVPGILRMPPGHGRATKDIAVASRLNVIEAGTLSAGGNAVVHPVVLDLLQQSNVRLQVCAGESNGQDGTVIERHRPIEASERIAGIAMQEVVSYDINDIRMEHQTGVVSSVTDAFSAHDVPLVDVVTGRGIIISYLTVANHAANNGLYDTLSEQYGETFSVRGGSEDDSVSIVTLVGEAMSQDFAAYASTISDALSIGLENDIAIKLWPSPNSDAIYVVVPTNDADRYAREVYDRFFGD